MHLTHFHDKNKQTPERGSPFTNRFPNLNQHFPAIHKEMNDNAHITRSPISISRSLCFAVKRIAKFYRINDANTDSLAVYLWLRLPYSQTEQHISAATSIHHCQPASSVLCSVFLLTWRDTVSHKRFGATDSQSAQRINASI